jgi:hypothetical protein
VDIDLECSHQIDMASLKEPFDSKSSDPPNFEATFVGEWNRAVSDYLQLTDPRIDVQNLLLGRRDPIEIVMQILQSLRSIKATQADQLFIAAVTTAGTHADVLGKTSILTSVPPIVASRLGTLLRYANVIGKLLETVAHGFSPAGFAFGAVWVLATTAVRNMKSFLALSTQFEEVRSRLQRMDKLLTVPYPAEAIISTFGRVMIDIILFCGHATKYIQGISFKFWN